MAAKIIPLGIGSGKPTKERHVMGLALVLTPQWFLFDGGEGTQERAVQAGLKLSGLSAIFITHNHGDHIFGLPGLLSTMSMLGREKPLDVVGPQELLPWIEKGVEVSHSHLSYEIRFHRVHDNFYFEGTHYKIWARQLNHVVESFGYRFEERARPGPFDLDRALRLGVPPGPLFKELQKGNDIVLPDGSIVRSEQVVGPSRPGKSLAFCLDTRPCEGTEALAKNVDLLIHEATFDHSLLHLAKQNGHSTASEAATMAKNSGAKRLVLTHFSSRYTDLNPLLIQAREIFPWTELARELFPMTF